MFCLAAIAVKGKEINCSVTERDCQAVLLNNEETNLTLPQRVLEGTLLSSLTIPKLFPITADLYRGEGRHLSLCFAY